MKSLTGSKRVIEILNRLAHTASYHTIEELETELTFQATEIGNCTPPTGMSFCSEQATSVAFGIFDSFMETLTGKDTLRDTVGIAYQSSTQQLLPCFSINTNTSFADFEIGVKGKRSDQEDVTLEVEPSPKKRKLDCTHISETEVNGGCNRISSKLALRKWHCPAYEASELEIEPYSRKPKIAAFSVSSSKEIRSRKLPENLENARYLDLLWMIVLCIAPSETPMWVGWNSIL